MYRIMSDFLRSLSGHLFYPNAIHPYTLWYSFVSDVIRQVFRKPSQMLKLFGKSSLRDRWGTGQLVLLLMVQKSGVHQLRLVVFSHYLQGFIHPTGGCLGFLPSSFFCA